MSAYQIQTIKPKHRTWIRTLLDRNWGGAEIVTRGRIHEADQLSGFVAFFDGQPTGLVTYHIEDDQCEIVTLDSLKGRLGIGTDLIEAVKSLAINAGCRRLWLITTNDNIQALRYYQKRGFQLANIYPSAIIKSRMLKPSIPEIGYHGIPIRDEIEFEILMKTEI